MSSLYQTNKLNYDKVTPSLILNFTYSAWNLLIKWKSWRNFTDVRPGIFFILRSNTEFRDNYSVVTNHQRNNDV